MASPGLFFDPSTGGFGFNPGVIPPSGGGDSGATCYELPSGEQIFLGSQDTIPAGAIPCSQPVSGECPTGQCMAQKWCHLASGQVVNLPIGEVPTLYTNFEKSGSPRCWPCSQLGQYYTQLCIPEPVKPTEECKPPCPPPGTSCANPLWIKSCPPDKPAIQPGGTGGSGGAGGGNGVGGEFNIAAIGCQGFDDLIAQFSGQEPLELLESVGILDADGFLAGTGGITKALDKIPWIGEGLGLLFQGIIQFPIFVVDGWMSVQQAIARSTGCDFGPLTFLATRRFFLTWARRLLGLEARQTIRQIDNAENYICPVNPPSIAEANLARRTGDIPDDVWRCWVRMNNVDERFEQQVYNALRVQLSPHEIISLWRRKAIGDDQVGTLLSQAGMISVDDQMRLDQVTQFIPPVTDLLHFIVRGIGDPEIVERFGLLDEFDQLYQGKLVDWGEANGISKEVMETYHAGHWVVPPTGQLFHMLQRLRPDSVPPGIAETDWTVTYDDVDRALRENAVAPFWRERLKAISYNPIPMRQAVHAFITGSADEDAVRNALLDNGYSPNNASIFIEWLTLQRRDHLRTNKIVSMYQGAGVNRSDAGQRLQEEGYFEQEVNDVLDWANQQADDKSREKCLAAIGRNYELGKLDETALQDKLAALGLDSEQITRLADQWECAKKAAGKEIPAGQLCSMVDNSLITPAEYYDRLRRLGYDDGDANRIVAECLIKLSERQLAARAKALQKAARDAASAVTKGDAAGRRAAALLRRQANDLRRLQREQASSEVKQQRELQRQIDRASRQTVAATRMRLSSGAKARAIEQRLARAAQIWAETSGKPLDVAASEIRSGIDQAVHLEDVSEDQAIRAALLAALGAKKRGTVDLVEEILDIARLLLAYADTATVAVSEQTVPSLPTAQSSAGNVDQATTNGNGGVHPVG